MNYRLFFFFIILGFYTNLQAQNDAFENEVSKQGDLLYFKDKPLSGTLYSTQDGINNECDCTLKAKYKNGKLNGYKREWFTSGKLKYSGRYKSGRKTGTHVYYYESGKKKEVQKYINDVLIEKITYYSNGNIQRKERYKNGEIDSFTDYNKDGSEKGKPKIIVTATSGQENGKTGQAVIISGAMTQNGLQKFFYPSGLPKRIKFYKEGLLVKDSLFFENGKLQTVKKYNDGELIHFEKFNEKSKILQEENYLNNKKEGLQKTYFENGQPKILENYEGGQLIFREEYNENGMLVKEENYRFGKKNGLQKTYDAQGKLIELEEYNMNKLLRHERYTDKGKESININGDLSEIKTYNKNDKLVQLRYENIKTNKPDSLWITYDPISGNKIVEKAYHNGKLVRKGQYANNKKDGEWYIYWQNGLKETCNTYDNGKLVESTTSTYAKQIKNHYKKSDIVFRYKVYIPKEKYNYILVRFDSIKTQSEKYIKEKIIESYQDSNLDQVEYNNSVKNKELEAILQYSDYGIRLKRKNNDSNRFITYIKVSQKYEDLEKDVETSKNYVCSPITQNNHNLNSLYVKDKKEAFFMTLKNLGFDLRKFIAKHFSLTGYVKAKTKSGSSVDEVYINLGANQNVQEGDLFDVLDKEGNIRAKIKITSTMPDASIARVTSGHKNLFALFSINKKAIAKRILYENK